MILFSYLFFIFLMLQVFKNKWTLSAHMSAHKRELAGSEAIID
jgi:hypothetical protein